MPCSARCVCGGLVPEDEKPVNGVMCDVCSIVSSQVCSLKCEVLGTPCLVLTV